MLVAYIVTVSLLVAGLLLAFRRERTSARELIREVDRQTRLRETRENELLDRLAHAYDKPWVEPPAEESAAAEDEDEPDELRWDMSHLEDEVLAPAGESF